MSTHSPKWTNTTAGTRRYIPVPDNQRVTITIGPKQYRKASDRDRRGGDHTSERFRSEAGR